ncbi:MAG: polysaccharide deacetylase [Oscillospiraceae bacterium]|nr:polysaccharide deacetylase [Oscillospiraceae bacterium]
MPSMVGIESGIWLEAIAEGDSLDWKGISADEITKRVVSKVSSGSIVLFHNAAIHTPEALPGIIEALLKDGYTFVPISQLILTCDYIIDHTGRQIAATQSTET